MLSNDITINTHTYALQTQRVNSSIRGNAAKPLDNPETMSIAHEVLKSGRVNSVLMFDNDRKVAPTSTCSTGSSDTIKVQFKISYNPLGGRDDVEATLSDLKASLVAFLASDDYGRFLNKES